MCLFTGPVVEVQEMDMESTIASDDEGEQDIGRLDEVSAPPFVRLAFHQLV